MMELNVTKTVVDSWCRSVKEKQATIIIKIENVNLKNIKLPYLIVCYLVFTGGVYSRVLSIKCVQLLSKS